jgi:hypothetical protein
MSDRALSPSLAHENKRRSPGKRKPDRSIGPGKVHASTMTTSPRIDADPPWLVALRGVGVFLVRPDVEELV